MCTPEFLPLDFLSTSYSVHAPNAVCADVNGIVSTRSVLGEAKAKRGSHPPIRLVEAVLRSEDFSGFSALGLNICGGAWFTQLPYGARVSRAPVPKLEGHLVGVCCSTCDRPPQWREAWQSEIMR
eukprot:489519-Amphidinium_carterae.2